MCVGLYVKCLICPVLTKIESLDKFKQKYQIYHFTKIRVMGIPLIHADKRTDRHNDANSRFSQLLHECAQKLSLRAECRVVINLNYASE